MNLYVFLWFSSEFLGLKSSVWTFSKYVTPIKLDLSLANGILAYAFG